MIEWIAVYSASRCVRVVKEMDLKSIGLARAGSNPAGDVFIFYLFILIFDNNVKFCYKVTELILYQPLLYLTNQYY